MPSRSTNLAGMIRQPDGEPWWLAKDVCDAIGINNAPMAISRLDEDKATISNVDGRAGFGPQAYAIINESGLYSLILTSRKPEAKAFKKWVTHEVLPAIRKTGSYSISPDLTRRDLTSTARPGKSS